MAKASPDGPISLVSRPIVLEGDLSGDENLHIDGRVVGTVRLTGDLFIGPTGSVEGEVDARDVVIQGAVNGKLTARRQLEIAATGRFNGECQAASIQIHEGAVFEGTSRMLAGPTPAGAAPHGPRNRK